jgi:hypothetical protein
MRTITAAILAILASAPVVTVANAQSREPRAEYAQMRQGSGPVARQRQAVRDQQPVEAAAFRSCNNITCPGFILIGVGF